MNTPNNDGMERLLKAIFDDVNGESEPDDDYPKTIHEKVACAEHTAVGSLDHLGYAIQRLSRFHRLLVVAGDEPPKIITYNEAKVAHTRLMHVKIDIDDAVSMMEQVMRETKQGATP